MEDEYELVSKSYLKDLKEENSKLKKKLDTLNSERENINSNKNKENRFSEIIFTIQEEAKKEREEILNQLNKIKDLNEKTLSSTLNKSELHDNKFEDMINTMKELISTLNDVVVEVSKNNLGEFNQVLTDIKINLENKNKSKSQDINSISKQLKDIELFMINLRTLLSYVKPNDLTLNKPNQ